MWGGREFTVGEFEFRDSGLYPAEFWSKSNGYICQTWLTPQLNAPLL